MEIQIIKNQWERGQEAEPIFGVDGKLWHDEPEQDIWEVWQKSIQHMSRIDYTKIPSHVMDYFQQTKGFDAPPSRDFRIVLDVSPQRINVKVEKPAFTWSFSTLSKYGTCPYQLGQVKYYKTVKEKYCAECVDGIDVHEILKNYLRREEITPAQVKAMASFQKYADHFLKLEDAGAELLIEKELAITEDFNPCDWFAPNAWGRAKLDVGIIRIVNDIKRLDVFDWKTGKKKDEELQLKIFSMFGMIHHPDVETFNAQYIWTNDKPTGLPAIVDRATVQGEFIPEIMREVNRMKNAWESENFPKQQNYLCKKYCPVLHCEHCKK